METPDAYGGPFPVIGLAGTNFHVNAYALELSEVSDPENKITVMDMLNLEDHMELLYDRETKNAWQGYIGDAPPQRVQLFWLRPFGAMDPQGMAAKMEELNPGMPLLPENLPVIAIAGRPFFVDDNRKAFRDLANPWNMIFYNDVVQRGGQAGVFLDKVTSTVPFPHEFNVYDPTATVPDHIEFAAVPSGPELARMLNEDRSARQAGR